MWPRWRIGGGAGLTRLAPCGGSLNVPCDLAAAGIGRFTLTSEAVRLYACLTPEQRVKAGTEAGLSYRDMTRSQRDLVRQSATSTSGQQTIAEGEICQAIYRVKQSVAQRERLSRDVSELQIQFPGQQLGTTLLLEPVRPRPASSPARQAGVAP